MSNYFFTDKWGDISKKEYNDSDKISLKKSFEIFISNLRLKEEPIFNKIENTDATYKIDVFGTQIYACICPITPGGRSIVIGTEDSEKEFRIMLKPNDYNFIYKKREEDNISIMIGVYFFDGLTVFSAWKPKSSNAQEKSPVSKQIDIESIGKALKDGFYQYKNKKGEYVCVFLKELLPFYIKNSKWLHADKISKLNSHIIDFNDTHSTHTPTQTIYYGVPGSGKSHKIDSEIKSKITDKTEREEQTIRVVFHPEYTNADFVGQILPHVEDTVDYRFKAGPFSRILKKAYENPTKPYFLVIEEINRGNAAAIFGDFFQLLDRDSDGWSSYSVENLDINAFIRSNDSTYTDKYSDIPTTKEIGNTTWTENTGIRLPPNLSILASMNTSDQNVFTLDNAFQRRWDMELVPNNCADSIQMGAKIGDTGITWGNFQSKINEIIGNTANESGFSSMEDKRLGCWFIKNENENIDKEKFANKVLKYLWDDAFKFNRTEIFVDGIKNFEDLKQKFKSDGFSIFNNVDFAIETKTASEVESNDNSSEENQSEESTEN